VSDLGVARLEIVVHVGEERIDVVATHGDEETEAPERFEMIVAGVARGEVIVFPRAGHVLTAAQRDVVAAAATQIGLAVERAALDLEVREARREAESNETRAAPFSSVTHDLRTPLSAIKASVSSLRTDTALAPRQRADLLTTVADETDRLDRLVGNILDLARARAGGIILEREKTGVDEVIGAVLTRLRPRLGDVDVRILIRPTVADVWADPVQFDQVITNILENALAASPPGGRIDISAAQIGSLVEVRIADEGPGIQSDERDRVFEPVRRGGGGGGAGSGLGLSIVRAIVTAHGGTVRIEESPGGGAAVVFTMPAWRNEAGP
jgi:two-component system sensor histidine kinase KdpD